MFRMKVKETIYEVQTIYTHNEPFTSLGKKL